MYVYEIIQHETSGRWRMFVFNDDGAYDWLCEHDHETAEQALACPDAVSNLPDWVNTPNVLQQ